jgi:hypothetical protein
MRQPIQKEEYLEWLKWEEENGKSSLDFIDCKEVMNLYLTIKIFLT